VPDFEAEVCLQRPVQWVSCTTTTTTTTTVTTLSRSQWPRGLRRRSTAARLLISWVPIPPRAWMFVL